MKVVYVKKERVHYEAVREKLAVVDKQYEAGWMHFCKKDSDGRIAVFRTRPQHWLRNFGKKIEE
jgi:hypothetical protein